MQHRHQQRHFWHFLKNKEMNEIYLAYGIDSFAMGLVSIFVPIYLYKIGYSIDWIIFYYFLVPLNTLIFSSLIAKFVAKFGVKYSIMISGLFKVVFFVSLRLLPVFPWLFAVLPTFNVLKTQFASLSYHLNFVEHSDAEHRGRQVGALQSTALVATILAPLLGGYIIGMFGFKILFAISIALIFISAIPILLIPHKKSELQFDGKGIWRDLFKPENKPLFTSYGGYAMEEWIGYVIWSLFLFLMLQNTEKVGIVNTIVSAATFLVFYAVGRLADKKDKRHLIKIGNILYFFGWVGRVFADSFSSVLFVDTYKNITGNILHLPWSAYSYDLAAKHNYFRFIVQREIMFDLTRVLFVPVIMLIFAVGFQPFMLAFILAATFSLGYMAIDRVDEARV